MLRQRCGTVRRTPSDLGRAGIAAISRATPRVARVPVSFGVSVSYQTRSRRQRASLAVPDPTHNLAHQRDARQEIVSRATIRRAPRNANIHIALTVPNGLTDSLMTSAHPDGFRLAQVLTPTPSTGYYGERVTESLRGGVEAVNFGQVWGCLAADRQGTALAPTISIPVPNFLPQLSDDHRDLAHPGSRIVQGHDVGPAARIQKPQKPREALPPTRGLEVRVLSSSGKR